MGQESRESGKTKAEEEHRYHQAPRSGGWGQGVTAGTKQQDPPPHLWDSTFTNHSSVFTLL